MNGKTVKMNPQEQPPKPPKQKDRSALKQPGICLQDSSIVVAEKPEGWVIYSNEPHEINHSSLQHWVQNKMGIRLFPVHRIDKDTHGLVLFARSSKIASLVIDGFRRRAMQKTYLTWVWGEVPLKGRFTDPLKKNKSKDKEPAVTEFARDRVIDLPAGRISAVSVFPKTGRYHQIRRHFAMHGFPIVGDVKYGSEDQDRRLSSELSLALIAKRLEFVHPVTKKNVVVEAKIPKELQRLFSR